MKAKFVPRNKIILTPDQEVFLRENYHSMRGPNLAANLGIKTATMRARAHEMGVRRFENEYWTDDQVEFLEFTFRVLGDSEIAEYLQRFMPKKKNWTKQHIEKKRRYLKLVRTREEIRAINKRNTFFGCFSTGHALMWDKRGRRPEGSVVCWRRSDGGNHVCVKVKGKYVLYHPWLWEKHYGKVPEGMVVYCEPGAPLECDISHLSLKTKAEIMDINRYADRMILSRQLKVKDRQEQQEFIENYPEVIELARATMKLNGALRAAKKKKDGR